MTRFWDFSIRQTRIAFWKTCESGWPSLDWNYTQTRRAGLSSAGLPRRTGDVEEKESRRRSTFWASRISAGKTVSGASWCGAKRPANAYGASCERSSSSCGCACTIHCPKPEDGCSRSSKAFNYYAVPGNLASLGAFRYQVLALWWRTLHHRSQRRRLAWTRILALASSTTHVSSFSGCPLFRYSSAIRIGCANERSSGSEEGS
jgi:hypothetical protein